MIMIMDSLESVKVDLHYMAALMTDALAVMHLGDGGGAEYAEKCANCQ